MPILTRRAQHAFYELQEFCRQQNDNCEDCALKYQCTLLWRGNSLCDLELPKQTDIVYGCTETECCSEYIMMYTQMSGKLRDLEDSRKRTIIDNELLRFERDSLVNILDRLCPDWKNQIRGTKNEKDCH